MVIVGLLSTITIFILYESNRIIKNKYFIWYLNIITNAQNRIKNSGYCEQHHIIPKSIFDKIIISTNTQNVNINDKENIIKLTAREHFIVHRLLPKFTEGYEQEKMIYAMYGLAFQSSEIQDRYKTNSRTYEYIKKEFIKNVSGEKHWTTKRTKEELSEIALKREATYTKEQKEEIAKKISKSLKGKPKGENWHLNAPKAMKGKKKTITQKLLDSRKKIKEEYTLGLRTNPMQDVIRDKSPCPHCNKLVDVANMQRWHGDNCKLKDQASQ